MVRIERGADLDAVRGGLSEAAARASGGVRLLLCNRVTHRIIPGGR
jgi:hypothetical protein